MLYVGDHIYGDILRSKKDTAWRTAMIIQELETEVAAYEYCKQDIERGAMLDRLHRRQVPVYFQMGGEGFGERQLVAAYYHAGLMRRSQIADARRPGEGVLQFAADPAAGQRLASWLKEVVTAAPSPHATPPPTQRPK